MAHFEKGQSGNPEGRPSGSPNKTTQQIREVVRDFIDLNFEKLQNDFDKLRPKDRVRYTIALLRYILPTAREIDLSVSLQQLSDEQIDELVKKILQNGT